MKWNFPLLCWIFRKLLSSELIKFVLRKLKKVVQFVRKNVAKNTQGSFGKRVLKYRTHTMSFFERNMLDARDKLLRNPHSGNHALLLLGSGIRTMMRFIMNIWHATYFNRNLNFYNSSKWKHLLLISWDGSNVEVITTYQQHAAFLRFDIVSLFFCSHGVSFILNVWMVLANYRETQFISTTLN